MDKQQLADRISDELLKHEKHISENHPLTLNIEIEGVTIEVHAPAIRWFEENGVQQGDKWGEWLYLKNYSSLLD